MKYKIAIITSRIEPSQTFLFRDICNLSKYIDISLHQIMPARQSSDIKKIMGNKQNLIKYYPLTNFINILLVNLKMFFQYPGKYIYYLLKIIKTHYKKPFTLAISVIFYPIIIAHVKEMKRKNVQHVHGYWANYAATFAMIAAGHLSLPFSFSVHAYDLFEDVTAFKKKIGLSTQIIACSKFACSVLKNRMPDFDPVKVNIQYHGIDIQKYHFSSRKIKNKYDTLEIISIGRIIEKKGFIILIKAVNLLAVRGMKINCTICGPVRDKKYLKLVKSAIKNSHENVKIILTGWIDHDFIIQKMNECDIYVQPSVVSKKNNNIDGIPNTLLESMALGIPVVASDAGGIPEVVYNNETGILVNQGDPLELAQAIIYTLDNPKNTLYRTKQARMLIESKFNIYDRVKNLADILIKNSV